MSKKSTEAASKERGLELIVPLLGLLHQGLKFRLAAQASQQRIALEVGITEESPADAMAQHVQCRNFIAQYGVGLGNFVNPFGVAYTALVNLAFGLLEKL